MAGINAEPFPVGWRVRGRKWVGETLFRERRRRRVEGWEWGMGWVGIGCGGERRDEGVRVERMIAGYRYGEGGGWDWGGDENRVEWERCGGGVLRWMGEENGMGGGGTDPERGDKGYGKRAGKGKGGVGKGKGGGKDAGHFVKQKFMWVLVLKHSQRSTNVTHGMTAGNPRKSTIDQTGGPQNLIWDVK
ncbi:hypothetical protein Tco_0885067 [Tanacetum coccineum]